MKTVIVGAGNVATHVALALAGIGEPPKQIWSRTAGSAAVLAAQTGSSVVTDVADLMDDADIYIVAVKDSAMRDVIGRLCDGHRNGVFVHTAGTMSMRLFEGRCERYGVLYPMQTFSKNKALDFSDIPCFVEASDTDTLGIIRTLAEKLSRRVYELGESERRWLHVAAVFACNFSNACYTMAEDILQRHGIDFDVMLPLIDETTAKLHSLTPSEAQTGPAVREDHNVMDKHLNMLAGDSRLQGVYRMMSDIIIDNKRKNK